MLSFIKNLFGFLRPVRYPEWWHGGVSKCFNVAYSRGKLDCSNQLTDAILYLELYYPDAFPKARHVWNEGAEAGHAIGIALDKEGIPWFFDNTRRKPTKTNLLVDYDVIKDVPKHKLGNPQYPEWCGIKYTRDENGEIVEI